MIQLLQQNDADIGSTMSLLAKEGKRQSLETLIQSGIPFDVVNETGQTGLHIAARNGKLSVVKMYIEKGLNVHTNEDNGYIALHRAAGYGRKKVAQYLLEQGSNPNWAGLLNNWTPSSLAARYGHLDVLKLLHSKGGNLNNITSKG